MMHEGRRRFAPPPFPPFPKVTGSVTIYPHEEEERNA